MDYQDIRTEDDGYVRRVITSRPQYRNAQSRRLLEELDDAFAAAAEDTDVRVVVLLGDGDHFSGGHDLGTPEEKADRERRPRQEGVRGRFHHSRESFVNKTLRWRDLPMPTIAGVQGYCIFGGWMVASAMDIICRTARTGMLCCWKWDHARPPTMRGNIRTLICDSSRRMRVMQKRTGRPTRNADACSYTTPSPAASRAPCSAHRRRAT